jgi:riboflavin kinase / FMN adenylyltransferase
MPRILGHTGRLRHTPRCRCPKEQEVVSADTPSCRARPEEPSWEPRHLDQPGRKAGRAVWVWRERDHAFAPGTGSTVIGAQRCVATIGVFDGVHRGHQRIVWRALARAAELRLPAVGVTFDPLPEVVVRPASAPPLLTTLPRRLELLADLGLDGAYVVDFTPELSKQEPAQFATSVLVETLRAVDVVVGENFRFGRRAAGDVDTLREVGAAAGFMVDAVSLAHPDAEDRAFSSTWIRERIAAGDVEGATAALGRPHRLEGVVIHGDHRGRELGYPTANLDVPSDLAVPADGVYAGWLDDMPAAISIGTNPTFAGTARRVEAYAIDRDLDLYGRLMTLDFVARLRGMVTFDGVEPLRVQMAADVEQCRRLLAPPPSS